MASPPFASSGPCTSTQLPRQRTGWKATLPPAGTGSGKLFDPSSQWTPSTSLTPLQPTWRPGRSKARCSQRSSPSFRWRLSSPSMHTFSDTTRGPSPACAIPTAATAKTTAAQPRATAAERGCMPPILAATRSIPVFQLIDWSVRLVGALVLGRRVFGRRSLLDLHLRLGDLGRLGGGRPCRGLVAEGALQLIGLGVQLLGEPQGAIAIFR